MDRVGVDLERRGKARRQAGRGTWISGHDERALPSLHARLSSAALFARCDPPHAGTPAQVERLLAAGVRVLMLPMYRTPEEVRRFVAAVGGRAGTVLLLETAEAVRCVHETVRVPGVDELHVGLNDLALSHGLPSRFAALAAPVLDDVADAAHAAGVALGVGGVARVGDRTLPVDPDLVYARLAGLRATGALVSRSFLTPGGDLTADVAAARERFARWSGRGEDAHRQALARLRRRTTTLTDWP